jgi:hypothetical protein
MDLIGLMREEARRLEAAKEKEAASKAGEPAPADAADPAPVDAVEATAGDQAPPPPPD